MRGSSSPFPDCVRGLPTRLRKASPVSHPIGGANPFARVERHRARMGVPSKNLAPGFGRELLSGSSAEGVRLAPRPSLETHRQFDQPPSCQNVLVQGLRQESPRRLQVRLPINCHASRSHAGQENGPSAPRVTK